MIASHSIAQIKKQNLYDQKAQLKEIIGQCNKEFILCLYI